ncbi:pyridoxal phosphate phosphatase PHOSPHO2-like [Sabethes cyaneus]|uniref:pyridoxal phosphate phosphatase PHOSPHO2-like n=1 Tax=Sabethes cyaneus TaxID=53552 RepID=UPI00237ECD06|nr:pyridoxal phosphate phosphatase PHOSPHO2-like [Sabethes cyaneus]
MLSSKRILKRLAIFDFDHTICEYNTDIVVRDLLKPDLITSDIKSVRSCGWIRYMQRIFELLHKNGYSKIDIQNAIQNIPEVKGIKQCIEELAKNNFHIIIISDSNSEFIETWNSFNNIGSSIHTVFTNPASYNSEGMLQVRPYHYQTKCDLSSRNLCKGLIMENFLSNQYDSADTEYDKIFYIGDGKNDVCPMLRLKENGYACPREGYACCDALNSAINQRRETYKAKILKWNTGTQLMSLITKELDVL